MKILCVSDEVDPLVYSPRIKERFGDVEFVVAAGDLPMDYLEFIVSMLNKPLFFVQGNHDLPFVPNEIPGMRAAAFPRCESLFFSGVESSATLFWRAGKYTKGS